MAMNLRQIDGHSPITRSYGDGYHEPREEHVCCECGKDIWSWMQLHEETPDWEQDWLDHLTFVAHKIDPTPIYGELGDDYEMTYSRLNKELTDFGRIDCGIPGVRRETAGFF